MPYLVAADLPAAAAGERFRELLRRLGILELCHPCDCDTLPPSQSVRGAARAWDGAISRAGRSGRRVGTSWSSGWRGGCGWRGRVGVEASSYCDDGAIEKPSGWYCLCGDLAGWWPLPAEDARGDGWRRQDRWDHPGQSPPLNPPSAPLGARAEADPDAGPGHWW